VIALLERIASKFPRLYHYSPVVNRNLIEKHHAVFSADLIRMFATTATALGRRMSSVLVPTEFGDFTLNDQAALNYGHVKHSDSLSETDFAALLDQFAFFWPGSVSEPISMGCNFAGRYLRQSDSLLQLACSTKEFFLINNSARVFLSICNSGAPRSNPNAVIHRGLTTFSPLDSFGHAPRKIKEIAVMGYARLPSFEITVLTGSDQGRRSGGRVRL